MGCWLRQDENDVERFFRLTACPTGRASSGRGRQLPAQPTILRTAIGIRDGSKSTGVGFSIEVNGRTVSQQSLHPGGGWTPVTVDLSPWQGDAILLTLATDAQGDFSFDWAVWALPQLTGKVDAKLGRSSP
jgi:hypothetical protein